MFHRFAITGSICLAVMLGAAPSWAADVVLRMHQFLPATATIPANVLKPWADAVENQSGGRIKVEIYSSMQLGGKPSDLVDQVTDGTVDLAWTVIGYTPDRFPKSEAFELPFMIRNGESGSEAFYDYYQSSLKDEFSALHVLAVHTHGPGILHTIAAKPVHSLKDMDGLRLRGTYRVVNAMLEAMGATAVGLPVTAVPEAFANGVIQGTVVPWEVTPSIHMAELAPNHTMFSGDRGLYTATFLFAMNNQSYDRLPADLKTVIDDNSGAGLARKFGIAMDQGDIHGREIAEKAGNPIITLDTAETGKWKEASKGVTAAWIATMDAKGLDGTGLYGKAVALIAKYDTP